MTEYIHDEWCATSDMNPWQEHASDECDCYVALLVEKDKRIERLEKALHSVYVISPNDTLCKRCGTGWALGSPHEHHEEFCPLYKESEEK